MKELDIQLDKLAYDLVYCKCGGGHKTLSVADVRSAIDQVLAIQRGEVIEKCAVAAWNRAMDVCKEQHTNPAGRNDYFRIVGAIRALKG